MHIKGTDRREREWALLQEATDEKTTAGAIDVATRYYLEMAGGTAAFPTGRLEELMELAEEQGSVTAAEIAEVLDTGELPISYEISCSIGP